MFSTALKNSILIILIILILHFLLKNILNEKRGNDSANFEHLTLVTPELYITPTVQPPVKDKTEKHVRFKNTDDAELFTEGFPEQQKTDQAPILTADISKSKDDLYDYLFGGQLEKTENKDNISGLKSSMLSSNTSNKKQNAPDITLACDLTGFDGVYSEYASI